jgi:periplasmic protein TonB
MSKVSVFDHGWIDLVFEGRNQNYGAYQLRKHDTRTTLLALLSGIALLGAVVTVPVLINHFKQDLPPVPAPTLPNTTTVTPVYIVPLVEPKKPEPVVTNPAGAAPVNSTPTTALTTLIATSQPVTTPITTTATLLTTNPGAITTPGNPAGNPLGVPGGQPGGTGTSTTTTNTIGTGIATTVTVDVMPAFPGGMDAFYELVGNRFNTPDMDTAKTLKVFVYFVVETDGSMSGIKVARDPGYGLGNEAIRVLKSIKTKWKPGQIKGVNVRTAYNLPIIVNVK